MTYKHLMMEIAIEQLQSGKKYIGTICFYDDSPLTEPCEYILEISPSLYKLSEEIDKTREIVGEDDTTKINKLLMASFNFVLQTHLKTIDRDLNEKKKKFLICNVGKLAIIVYDNCKLKKVLFDYVFKDHPKNTNNGQSIRTEIYLKEKYFPIAAEFIELFKK
ncbi:MAG: hypothetical protein ABIA21_02045 [Candidatus Aenigmatarchaeota archaeon]